MEQENEEQGGKKKGPNYLLIGGLGVGGILLLSMMGGGSGASGANAELLKAQTADNQTAAQLQSQEDSLNAATAQSGQSVIGQILSALISGKFQNASNLASNKLQVQLAKLNNRNTLIQTQGQTSQTRMTLAEELASERLNLSNNNSTTLQSIQQQLQELEASLASGGGWVTGLNGGSPIIYQPSPPMNGAPVTTQNPIYGLPTQLPFQIPPWLEQWLANGGDVQPFPGLML